MSVVKESPNSYSTIFLERKEESKEDTTSQSTINLSGIVLGEKL